MTHYTVPGLLHGIYVASRVKHAPMWRGLRDMQRLPINSTWIDEDGEGETADFRNYGTASNPKSGAVPH
jgi:hypothetical protein